MERGRGARHVTTGVCVGDEANRRFFFSNGGEGLET